MTTPLDLRQLRSFVTVAEHLSFTGAARDLGVGQPALSAQIRALERAVGAVLLVRTTRRVELTPAGVALLPSARTLLADAELAVRTARHAHGRPAVHLDVVYDGCDTGAEVVRELIAAGHPVGSVHVEHRGGVAAQLDRLRGGALDVGMGRAHELPADLEHEVVRYEPLVVLSRSPRFAGLTSVAAEELVEEPLTVQDIGGTAPEWVDFSVRNCGAESEQMRAAGLAAAMSVADPHRSYVGLSSMRPLTEMAGWACIRVTGWPAYPWSVLWLRSRRDDVQVAAVRGAARLAGERLGWLPGGAPPVEDQDRPSPTLIH